MGGEQRQSASAYPQHDLEAKDKMYTHMEESSNGLRGLCQRGGGGLLGLRDPLSAPLCDLCALIGDEDGGALVPLMGPVA